MPRGAGPQEANALTGRGASVVWRPETKRDAGDADLHHATGGAERDDDVGKRKLSQNQEDWVEARKRHHLSHAHVQMAQELGMNPSKLGKLDHRDQEPWKARLPQFIEHLYLKRFGRAQPEVVTSIEERARAQNAKRAVRKEARRRARTEGGSRSPGGA
jgi:hypothetical protein